VKALKLERVSDDSWKPSHITGPNSFRSNKSSQNQISQVTCPPGPQQVTLMTFPITRQWDPTISHLEIQNQQPFKKIHKYKVVLFFQMWATKKNTFPITSTYSSLLFLTSMLQQATWAQICCVGIQRLICWYPVPGHPLRLPTKCLAHAPSFRLIYKGFAFFKGWKWKIYRLTIVQSGFLWFWGCFWKTGLGWVKSHASMS